MDDVLRVEFVTKRFPSVLANDAVTFSVRHGEIHALLGENGAGKSTLVKILYGLLQPDSGTLTLEGKPFAPANPATARESGIGMVFQHFSLFEGMTVAENIALGLPGARPDTAFESKVRTLSEEYGLPVRPTQVVGDLSVGERQRVEILRCLMQSPRLLIMDEPTSVLTPQEADDLFVILEGLRKRGLSILYISHRLSEIRALCQAATVMRGGKVVATCDPRNETARSLAEMMIGASLVQPISARPEPGPVRLKLEALGVAAEGPFGVPLEDISLSVSAGEIVGIGGVAGNGQAELLSALIGESPIAHGDICVDGVSVLGQGPSQRRGMGICFAPEERLGHALSPGMTLAENVLISARRRAGLSAHGVLNFGAAARFAGEVIAKFDVRTSGPQQTARTLSGGNLQKFSIGREIAQKPIALVAAQPTWGVDAAAAATVHRALIALAEAGTAVLVISQDLDELRSLSQRLAILSDGKLSEAVPTAELSLAEIGTLMGGRSLQGGMHATA
ncbi:MAG: ABC transporter ATP-binding protein [Pseudomonadota bacterium]